MFQLHICCHNYHLAKVYMIERLQTKYIPILDVLPFVQDLHAINRIPELLKQLQEECSHILKAEYNIANP